MGKIIGIDLGTTNSCVAVLEGGEPVVIPNSEGARTTPSVIGFAKDGERLVGQVAKHQAVANPDRTVISIKREMGTDHKVTIDGKQYSPQELSAMILSKLKADAESYLGTKVTGVIKAEQITDDPSAKLTSMFKVGDEVEAFVIRVSDVEGVAELSKKRVDADKNIKTLVEAEENKEVVEGKVTEVIKGGVIAVTNGIRVFIPASQTGLRRNEPMTELVGTTVRLHITEVNRARRRVVGSIRSVLNEERAAKSQEIWDNIEVDKHYKGVVKSLTSYGAFVDIGGVDGMVHISELSWSRIKHPSEVVSVGDEVDVYVIKYDPEKKKISLGMKDRSVSPWENFIEQYSVGDIASVKIVKLMSFGAFAEVVPGVDGLIHISQIADHRVEKPEDELEEGQIVDVKITDINQETQKVSLSRRAALREAAADDEEDYDEE